MMNPIDYLHESTVHQLRHAAEEIENGNGLVGDFDYEEEIEYDTEPSRHNPRPDGMRFVTLELTYLLPE